MLALLGAHHFLHVSRIRVNFPKFDVRIVVMPRQQQIYIGILLGARYILHISRIRVIKYTRHTYGNKVVKWHIEFNFPKFDVRTVVMPRQQQIFLCPLQSFSLELHNNWERRESIFMLLFRNWACPTVSDNELHMALFRCDGELLYGEGPGCSGFCLYTRPICKMVVPEMMYSLLWLISTIFCWNMTAVLTYSYDSVIERSGSVWKRYETVAVYNMYVLKAYGLILHFYIYPDF